MLSKTKRPPTRCHCRVRRLRLASLQNLCQTRSMSSTWCKIRVSTQSYLLKRKACLFPELSQAGLHRLLGVRSERQTQVYLCEGRSPLLPGPGLQTSWLRQLPATMIKSQRLYNFQLRQSRLTKVVGKPEQPLKTRLDLKCGAKIQPQQAAPSCRALGREPPMVPSSKSNRYS